MTDSDFAKIVDRTKGIVLSAIGKHLAFRFHHAIDDVVQETYMRAYKSLVKNKYQDQKKLQSWLYTIAKNESFRMNAKLDREQQKFHKAVDAMVERLPDKPEFDLEELHISIEKLPTLYKEVMQLVATGFSEKEISSKLELKKGTVKSRISRGRHILYTLLKGEV